MRILYISSRINAPDGSSVHGRAFVRNVLKLGHEIEAYPKIVPIRYIQDKQGPDNRSALQKISDAGVGNILKSRIRGFGTFASDMIDFYDGFVETARYCLAIRQILKNYSPDVIVFRATLFNFAPQIIRRIYKLPCVAEVNSIKYLEISVASRRGATAWLTKRAEQFAINRSDRVFGVSQSIKDFIDQFYPEKFCSVVTNGVETDDFDPALFNKEALKGELDLQDKIVLGYVGSYKKWHGLEMSLKVLKALNKESEKFVLLLIGNGEQYSTIKAAIKIDGLSHSVKQIDYVPHDEVPKYTAMFDYALMTYPDFDGFYFSPLKMYEYMSMGVPVVSTDTGQIGSIIRSGETGQLVYPPTVDNFVQALKSLETDPVLYRLISDTSRNEVMQGHSWLENANQVLKICDEIVGPVHHLTSAEKIKKA